MHVTGTISTATTANATTAAVSMAPTTAAAGVAAGGDEPTVDVTITTRPLLRSQYDDLPAFLQVGSVERLHDLKSLQKRNIRAIHDDPMSGSASSLASISSVSVGELSGNESTASPEIDDEKRFGLPSHLLNGSVENFHHVLDRRIKSLAKTQSTETLSANPSEVHPYFVFIVLS